MLRFAGRLPKPTVNMLSELHFSLVAPSVLRLVPAAFGAIAGLEPKELVHPKAPRGHRVACVYCTVCVAAAAVVSAERAATAVQYALQYGTICLGCCVFVLPSRCVAQHSAQ